MMNFIKSRLVYLAAMYAVLCFHMAIAQTANEYVPVSHEMLKIVSGESEEEHQIGLYSFASAVREEIINSQGSGQLLPAPDKFIIAQQKSNSNWWFAVKYYRTGSPGECTYIEEAIAYDSMISKLSKLDNFLHSLLDLKNYKSEDGGNLDALLEHINASLSDKLNTTFNVTTLNSDVKTYNSKEDVVKRLSEGCNKTNNLSDNGHSVNDDRIKLGTHELGKETAVKDSPEKSGGDRVQGQEQEQEQEQKTYWLKWIFLGTLIVLLMIAVIVIGFLFYRKVTRLFHNLGNLKKAYLDFDALANKLGHTYRDYKSSDLGNVKNDIAQVRTAQLKQQESLDSIDSKIDSVEKLAKDTVTFSDKYSKLQEQSRAHADELRGWLKNQIEESTEAGKTYNNSIEKLKLETGKNMLASQQTTTLYQEYRKSYDKIEELHELMQTADYTTRRDTDFSQVMQLLAEHFTCMHNFISLFLNFCIHVCKGQKTKNKTLTQEKDKTDKSFQALKSQVGNLKKVNQQIYRQGGLHLSEEENKNITLEKLVELGNLYSKHQTIQQYVLAMNALKDRLSSPSSTKEPFFRAVGLDVLIDKLNDISGFQKFYERDELSDILNGHWKQYIYLIFRACLLINSYFKLDRHNPILIDLKLAKSAAAKLLKEHNLIPDYFELPVASDKIEGKFEIVAYSDIPSDLANYDGFKNKVQDLHRSGVNKAVCYVNRWGLRSQKEELCINTVLASLERSNKIVQDWGD